MAATNTTAPKMTSTRSEPANPRQERVTRDPARPVLGAMAQAAWAGAATVKVAEAILLLWRPLAWKLSCRPGIVDPAKPLGTANDAAIWPPVVALAVVSTVAPKLMATGSEGVNPRQERVTRDPAGPVFGERAHLGLAGVTVGAVVVPVDPAVGWVVAPAVGLVVGVDDGPEEDAAAV